MMPQSSAEENKSLIRGSKNDHNTEVKPLTETSNTSTSQQTSTFPLFDRDLTTRNVCIAGIAISYIFALLAIALSLHIHRICNAELTTEGTLCDHGWTTVISMISSTRTPIDLALNFAVTLCTESLGYVHSTSLRWALWREGRLAYNSNLRLLNRARRSAVNSWYANTISSITLVVTYVSASQVLVPMDPRQTYPDRSYDWQAQVNAVALLFLGVGLFVQAALAHACLWRQSTRIPTWSSNVLSVTLACLHRDSSIQPRQGRCMLSVLDGDEPSGKPKGPKALQPSLRMADVSTRHITRFIWALFPMTLIWAITIYVVAKDYAKRHPTWIGGPRSINMGSQDFSSHLYFLLFVGTFQAFATLGLHSAELLVNRSRDEVLWRRAACLHRKVGPSWSKKMPGAPKSYGSIIAALSSWQSVGLFILKPIVHWLFGSSLSAKGETYSLVGTMSPPYTFGLAAGILVLATFGTILSRRRPVGCIPAAWGHLQTLADLIDDWGDGTVERLYWGDKGQGEDGIRHAGTSSDVAEIDAIHMDALYRGKG